MHTGLAPTWLSHTGVVVLEAPRNKAGEGVGSWPVGYWAVRPILGFGLATTVNEQPPCLPLPTVRVYRGRREHDPPEEVQDEAEHAPHSRVPECNEEDADLHDPDSVRQQLCP